MGVTLTDTPDEGGALAPAQPRRGRPPAPVQPKPLAVQGDMTMLNLIAAAATNPNVDVAKMSALLDMGERVERRQAEAEFNQAFIRLQSRLPRITRKGALEYPTDKNKPDGPKRKIASFARWEDIDAAIRPLLEEEGFALSFNTVPRPGDGGGLIVTAILRHTGGHSQETSIPVPLDSSGGKNNLQGYGSSLSYGKRYAATAALNIITEGEDDDGHKGGSVYVDDVTAKLIEDLLVKSGANRESFLDYMGAEDVPAILERDKAKAINGLMARLNRPREAAQ